MISLIVAHANDRVIGDAGKIPWHLPNDLKHFKKVTSGHTILMGRKTFESIGRPLPNRRNIVLTHSASMHIPDVEVVGSIEEVLTLGDMFVIGGETLYTQLLPLAERLYITEITLQVSGDTFFPEWDTQLFTLVSRQEGILDEKNRLVHRFYLYERRSKQS